MNNQITATQNTDLLTTANINTAPFDLLKQHVQMIEMCGQLGSYYSQTNLVPKQYQGKQGDCAVAIQWGSEIGLSPLQSLQNIAVINGTPALWGDSLVALVLGSGLCEFLKVDWCDKTQTATATTRRKGQDFDQERTYSMGEAKTAGLAGRDTYIKYGKRMVSNRARAYLLRDVYADVLKGLRIREVEEDDLNNDAEKEAHKGDLNALLTDTDKSYSNRASKRKGKPEAQKEVVIESEPVQAVEEEVKQPEESSEPTQFEIIKGYIDNVVDEDSYNIATAAFNKAAHEGGCSSSELEQLLSMINLKSNN